MARLGFSIWAVTAKSACTLKTSAGSSSAAAGKVGDECTCLRWNDTYATELIECGRGIEYQMSDSISQGYKHNQDHDIADLYMEFCPRFFHKITDNFCVNHALTQEGGQWCYVSPSCKRGVQVPCDKAKDPHCEPVPVDTIKLKMCSRADGDPMSFDMDPLELTVFARDHGLNPALLARFVYPVAPVVWEDIADFFTKEHPVDQQMASEMQALVESNRTMFFNGRGNFGLGAVLRYRKIFGPVECDDMIAGYKYICVKEYSANIGGSCA